MAPDSLDQTYLSPLAPCVIEAVLTDHDGSLPDYRVEFDHEDDRLRVFDGDMLVLETVATIHAGTVLRIAPMMGDAFEMASFMSDRKGADTLVECEIKAGRIEDVAIETLHGMAAARIKGKWRPIDPAQRALWAQHAATMNTARLRSQALMVRAA